MAPWSEYFCVKARGRPRKFHKHMCFPIMSIVWRIEEIATLHLGFPEMYVKDHQNINMGCRKCKFTFSPKWGGRTGNTVEVRNVGTLVPRDFIKDHIHISPLWKFCSVAKCPRKSHGSATRCLVCIVSSSTTKIKHPVDLQESVFSKLGHALD